MRSGIFVVFLILIYPWFCAWGADPPANDRFAEALDLQQARFGSLVLDFPGAGLEPGESLEERPDYPASLWYTWQAPHTGWLAFSTDSDTLWTLYQGNDLANLLRIDPSADGSVPEVLPLPENLGPQDSFHWWRWTAPADGIVRLTLAPEYWDTWSLQQRQDHPWIGVYQGDSLETLEPVFVPDERVGVSFPAVSGTTYSLLVAARDSGAVDLRWQIEPDNDLFEAATDLGNGESLELQTTLEISGFQQGEPSIDEPHFVEGTQLGSRWWRWTAPADGTLVLSGFGRCGGRCFPGICRASNASRIDGSNMGQARKPKAWSAREMSAGFVSPGGPTFFRRIACCR